MQEISLLTAAAACYGAACLLALAYLFAKNDRWSGWMLRLASAGAVLHLASFALRLQAFWAWPENRFLLPIDSFTGAMSFFSLAAALAFFLVEREHRLGILGAFVLPWAALGAFAAAGRAEPAALLAPELRSVWLNVHPMLLMTAYALFGNAFGVGLALLVQERQLKSRHPGGLAFRLPSIEELDRLQTTLIAAGLPVLVAGIVIGMLWAHEVWQAGWHGDPKVLAAVATALLYAGYLHLHRTWGVRGRRAAYVAMTAFAAVVFTFVGIKHVYL